MNIIVFSQRLGNARPFEIKGPWGIAAVGFVGVALFTGIFLAGLWVGGSLSSPDRRVTQWAHQLEKQKADIAQAKRGLQDKLDALATRVGQMNAHIIRLDALGRRLTSTAKLDKGEFDFDRPPAQGGPETVVEGALVAAPELMAVLEDLAHQIQNREHQLGVLENMISTRNLRRQLLPDGRPVMEGYISSYFGVRPDPFTGHSAFHQGLDFAGSEGSQVVAVAAGVVTWSRDRFGYGLTVEVNHGNGYVTRYAHCLKTLVQTGDTVQKSQPVALMGSTGRSTGPHVHFEVIKAGHAINPMAFVGN